MHLAIALLLVGQIQMDTPEEVLEHTPIIFRSSLEIPEGQPAIHDWDLRGAGAEGFEFEDGTVFVVWAPPAASPYKVEHEVFIYDKDAGKFLKKEETFRFVVKPRAPPPPADPETDPTNPPPAPGKRLVVVVYESSQTRMPLQMVSARRQLEAKGHVVRTVDPDVETGTGQVPPEVRASIEAARKHGSFPALVISSGGDVIRTVTLPDTADEVVAEATR